MDILDEHGNGVRLEVTSIRIFFESFIKIWHQERCQDLTCPLSLFLESRRTSTFLMNLGQMGENILKKLLWKFHQDPSCYGWFIAFQKFGVVGGGWWKLEFSVNLNQIEIRFDLIRFDWELDNKTKLPFNTDAVLHGEISQTLTWMVE